MCASQCWSSGHSSQVEGYRQIEAAAKEEHAPGCDSTIAVQEAGSEDAASSLVEATYNLKRWQCGTEDVGEADARALVVEDEATQI